MTSIKKVFWFMFILGGIASIFVTNAYPKGICNKAFTWRIIVTNSLGFMKELDLFYGDRNICKEHVNFLNQNGEQLKYKCIPHNFIRYRDAYLNKGKHNYLIRLCNEKED